ncbi:hypothetical protein BVY01_00160 [bacterium I07]|nr:hypothetical protein BVY01_00160 [bacterium I07]
MNKPNSSVNPWLTLSKTVTQLLSQFPFYGHVLTSLARKMDKNLPFAAAIGIGRKSVLVINPDLFFNESNQHRSGLLIHEIEHVIRLHVPRFREKIKGNPYLKEQANIAMDLAVNSTIQKDLLPDWVLYPEQFDLPGGQTAEWYFMQLKDPQKKLSTTGTGDTASPATHPESGQLIRDDFDTTDLDEEYGDIPFELEKNIVHELVKNASLETDRSKGHIPGHVQEMIQTLNQAPRVLWNQVFRRLCQWASLKEKAYSKKRRSRRYGTRPGPYLKRRLKLVVAFDTSGSISTEDLAWFFSELDHLSKQGAQITLIQCDASIQIVETYARTFHRQSPQVYGRGGTAFTPVFEYLLEEKGRIPDLLVYFTDGYGDNPPDPKAFPVCWIYTPSHRKAVDFGFHLEYEPTCELKVKGGFS